MKKKKRRYPRVLIFGKEKYKLRFVKAFKDEKQVGECCPNTKTISILRSLDDEERVLTILHEALHAICFVYDIHISHTAIYDLEIPLLKFIADNLIDRP